MTARWSFLLPALLLGTAVLVGALTLAGADPSLPVDDAYISFSYARTLADGHGLRLTPLAERVEGFSNPLWVLTLALLAWGGAHLPVAALAVSWATGVATVWYLVLLTRRLTGTHWPACLSTSLFLLTPGLGFHLASGLETTAAGLALLVGFYGMVQTDGLRLNATTALGLVAFALLRPEGALLAGAWWLLTRERRPHPTFLLFIVPFATWLAFRAWYFGHWLPNSVVAKQGGALPHVLSAGGRYVALWAQMQGVVLMLSLVGLARLPRRQALIAGAPLLLLATTALAGGHVEGYPFQRYLYPLLPLLTALAGFGAWQLMPRGGLAGGVWVHAGAVVLLALGHAAVRASHDPLTLSRARLADHVRTIRAAGREPHDVPYPPYHRLAQWLRTSGRAGQRTAQQEVGITAFYSGLDVIDTFGLADATVARTPGLPTGRAAPAYVFGRRPDVFVLRLAADGLRPGLLADDVYATDPRLALEYDLAGFFPDADTRLLAAFTRRRGLLHARSLLAAVPVTARHASAASPTLATTLVSTAHGGEHLAATARLHFKRWVDAIQWDPTVPDGATTLAIDVPQVGHAAFEATVGAPGTGSAAYVIERLAGDGAVEPLLAVPVDARTPHAVRDVSVALDRWRGGRVQLRLRLVGADPRLHTPGWPIWMEPRLVVRSHPGTTAPPVTIVGARNAAFVDQDVPVTMRAARRMTVSITFRNTGQSPWTEADQFRLGLYEPRDSDVWGTARVLVTDAARVAAGQTRTFTFDIVAPAAPGRYPFQWRMLQEGREWFGAPSPPHVITVAAP